ncbi:MAG: hypothetical protein ABIK09_01215 [Pseudomonadota bacterium]
MKAHVVLVTLVLALTWSGAALAQSCEGVCGQFVGFDVCNCDSYCFSAQDCCEDICDFCEDDFPGPDECNKACEPAQTCGALGLSCGANPDCMWLPEFCGTCDEGEYCNAGTCADNPCEDAGDIPGCGGVCEIATWLGDSICDVNFDCAEMNWDNGDCEPPCEPVQTCAAVAVECGPHPECPLDPDADCGTCDPGFGCVDGLCVEGACEDEGDIPDCDDLCGPENWLADGFCDDGTFGYNFACEEFNWDEGDCAPPCEPTQTCAEAGVACGPHPECPLDPDADCGTCEDGSFCTEDSLCEVCDCGDMVCDFDECGNPCGDNEGECAAGACWDGACYDGAGCEVSDGPGCDGCGCEACVFALDTYCEETAWDGQCIQECILYCGGCGDQAGCGDGACDFPENCNTCADDCACPAGLACGFSEDLLEFECLEGSCEDGMEVGCCDGDVLNICLPGLGFMAFNCVDDGNVCGWADDELNLPRYYCGPAELMLDEDPSGTYPAACDDFTCTPDCTDLECGLDPICGTECGPCDDGDLCEDGTCVPPCDPDCTDAACGDDDGCGGLCDGDCPEGEICNAGVCEDCVPDCTDLECGPDLVCGEECGPCGDGQICNAGVCEDCTADCAGLDCGPDPVCGFECGPCGEGFSCDAGLCVEDLPPMDSCEGNCGVYAEDALCNCDTECFEVGDCCEDICDVCEADYPEDCGGACVPDCTGLDCGADPVCGEECGPCGDGFLCEEGACVEEGGNCVTICAGHCGDFAACDCGGCEDGYECLETLCELIVVGEDVVTGEDTVGPGEDTAGPGEDTTGGGGGGGGGGGCSTTGAPSPPSGLLVLFALMGLAVIRKVHA